MTTFATYNEALTSLEKNKWKYTGDGKGAPSDTDLQDFARIAAFLCNKASFEASLNSISAQLWDYYRSYDLKTRNKFTRALGSVAKSTMYGFDFQNRHDLDTSGLGQPVGIKLIGGDPQLGYMLRNKLFWKDSMDLKHGEHSHSLQWLAIAHGAMTVRKAGELYALTADYRTSAEGRDGKKEMVLWQWLADCFPSEIKTDDRLLGTEETLTSDTYRSPQMITKYLLTSNTGGPIPKHFVSNYLYHRYRNRKWLTENRTETYDPETGRKIVSTVVTSYDQRDPKGYAINKNTNGQWEKSTRVENRLLRKDVPEPRKDDPQKKGEITFHGVKGTLSFDYCE